MPEQVVSRPGPSSMAFAMKKVRGLVKIFAKKQDFDMSN